jgi:nucleoside-diphosphate-sugar epimerase
MSSISHTSKEFPMATLFVTGATGVLGRATIPQLVASGYTVRALSRGEANDAAIHALGGGAVRADLFDPESLRRAVAGADAILHLATRIPPSSEMRHRSAWVENDRIRAEGTKNLVDAALEASARVFVYPSFAFVYPDRGDAWIDAASTPIDLVDILHSTIAAERQVARFAAETGRRGVSLRLGFLYGSDLPSTREQLQLARRGISMFGSAPRAFTPTLWIGDAASALQAAIDRAPSGLYDVVDDEPLRQQQLKSALAAAAGRRRVLSLPTWLVRMMAGPTGEAFTRSLRISNRRFREATGWAPAVRNAVAGMALIGSENPLDPTARVPAAVRLGLWAMALVSLFAGIQQQFTPRSFYDSFPGFGMHWVAVDGPYNEHVLRDLGGANLALAAVILFAIARPTRGLVRAVAAAVLVTQVPHFIYHAAHLDLMLTSLDRVMQTVALTLTLVIPLLVLMRSSDMREDRKSPAAQPAAMNTSRAVKQESQLVISPQ